MRVLLTTDTAGGVWTHTKELTEGLLSRGAAVALVSFGGAPRKEQAGWAAATKSMAGTQFEYHSSPAALEWMEENAGAYRDGAGLLLAVAEEFAADVLHTNQFCFGALPVAIPKLVGAHSDVLSWARACRARPLERTRWLEQYEELVQRGLDGADLVAAPTEWMRRALLESFAVGCESRVVANGRRVERASAAGRKLQAITAGRLWDEAKGIATLLEIEAPLPFVVAGADRQEEPEKVRSSERVSFAGQLPEVALLALFEESAIYVATSLYEPFGLAPLEAALCGCALVVRDLPSLREVWGDAALYFNGTAGLEESLQMLARDGEQLRELQMKSQVRAQRYTREAMTDGYMTLYGSLLARRKGDVVRPTHEESLVAS